MRVVRIDHKTNTVNLCKTQYATDTFLFIYETVLFLLVTLVLPLVLLIVFNTRFIISYRRVKALKARMNLKDKRGDHITMLMIALVVVFIMCYAPVVTIYTLYKIHMYTINSDPPRAYWDAVELSKLFMMLNSSLTFVVYYAFNHRFRRGMLRMCGRHAAATLSTEVESTL